MKYKYLLATAAYTNPDLLEKCVKSWPRIKGVTRSVFIDYSPLSTDISAMLFTTEVGINQIALKEHSGVSGVWNTILNSMLRYYYDAVIVVGSDTEMEAGFLEKFLEDYEANNYDFATVEAPIGWNCWVMNRNCYNTVGTFDNNLFPAYYEDNDYQRRVVLSGLSYGTCGNLGDISHYGSATIQLDNNKRLANDVTFMMNKEYFIKKWGGLPGQETYTTPFNNPELTIKDWTLDKEQYEYKKSVWAAK